MNKKLALSQVMLGVASVTLSSAIFACASMNTVFDPITGVVVGTKNIVDKTLFYKGTKGEHDYLVTDVHHNNSRVLDGINGGRVVYDKGDMMMPVHHFTGDKITNLTTKKSGIITGIKHQGTMDVTTANGKNVRYQYVTFKVKPM
jgi:hypothetical protein